MEGGAEGEIKCELKQLSLFAYSINKNILVFIQRIIHL